MKKLIVVFFYCFVGFGMAFIPFPFYLFPYQEQVNQRLWGKFLAGLLGSEKAILVSSDTKGLYYLLMIIVGLALLAAFILQKISSRKKRFILISLQFIATYYLALHLFKYGFDKVFKAQFYLPEPNTLFTPLGYLDKDIAFWSVMGLSYGYSLFLGLVEVLAGSLLLWRKTRPVGTLLSIGIFINILAINFSFDISVKVFSGFLLLVSCLLFTPYASAFYQLFILQKNTRFRPLPQLPLSPFLRLFFSIFFTLAIISESMFPYFIKNNFQDDKAPRPFLHGAYQVEKYIVKNDTFPTFQAPIKRFFVHRAGFFIFQNQEDKMDDYGFELLPNQEFILTDYAGNQQKFRYHLQGDSLLTISKPPLIIQGKTIDWRKLPALKDDFQWVID